MENYAAQWNAMVDEMEGKMAVVVKAVKQKGCPKEVQEFLRAHADVHIDSEQLEYYWGQKPHYYCPSCTCTPESMRNDNIIVTAVDGGQLVGVSLLEILYEPYNKFFPIQGGRSVTLVHPLWQGKGIGTRMLREKLAALGSGYRVHATVGADNITSLKMCEKVYGKGEQQGRLVYFTARREK